MVKASDKAVQAIRDPRWLKTCMTGMGMDLNLMHEILALHGGPVALSNGPAPCGNSFSM